MNKMINNTKKIDFVSISMILLCFIGILGNSFIIVMPNRIAEMEHLSAYSVLGVSSVVMSAFLILLAILVLTKSDNAHRNFITGITASMLIGLTVFLVGLSARILTEGQGSSYRVTFGMGFYLIMLGWFGMCIKCSEHVKNKWMKWSIMGSGLLLIAGLFLFGWMDSMSIMIEYFTRQEKFWQLFWEHLWICIISIGIALAISLPLSYLCYKNPVVDRVIMGFLNLVRSIPAIALISIMVPVLSLMTSIPFFEAVGVSSFGATPVFIALFFYASFQIINSLTSALKTIEGNYLLTAKAMGMTNSMIMTKVQIPLIMPILVSGLKVVVVSTYTAASLGTLVGFGGLGVLIKMGSGNAIALDLILLGAIPIMIMVFITNIVLTGLANWLNYSLIRM